jgi:hypothetical protein
MRRITSLGSWLAVAWVTPIVAKPARSNMARVPTKAIAAGAGG